MPSADEKIRDILGKYDESFQDSVWRVQGTAVIYHKALERIATKADIVFERPQIIRSERDEAVIMVVGKMGDNEDCREEWSIGEALVNVNYRVSGKQAAYVYAMAEKRAKDRVILKLIELSGLVYSEDEADDFKRKGGGPPDDADRASLEFVAACKKRIADAADMATLAGWWNTEERKQAFRDFELTEAECRELQQLVSARADALKPRAVS